MVVPLKVGSLEAFESLLEDLILVHPRVFVVDGCGVVLQRGLVVNITIVRVVIRLVIVVVFKRSLKLRTTLLE